MEVTHSPVCREVLIVSGVSILNDCVFSSVISQEILVDASELIDDGAPKKVAVVLAKDFRKNIFY